VGGAKEGKTNVYKLERQQRILLIKISRLKIESRERNKGKGCGGERKQKNEKNEKRTKKRG
jgi:hypothetical protein